MKEGKDLGEYTPCGMNDGEAKFNGSESVKR